MKTPKQIKDSTMIAVYALSITIVIIAVQLSIGLILFIKNIDK